MQSTISKVLKIEKVKSLKIGLPKKIGQLRFKYKDKCAAFNLKWKGIPEVRRAHEKGLKLVCWLVQQKFVSRPKSSSRNIRTGELSQERWSHAMECTIKS